LWRILSADYCHLNEIAVPILIHCLVYESGQKTFWSLVDKDFKDLNWKIRMQSVSKVVCIAQNLNARLVRAHYNVFSSLALAFSNFFYTIYDIEPIVSQKAISLIETLNNVGLHSILLSLELQFDAVIADRPIIIQVVSIFYSSMPAKSKATLLNWEFFLHRFNTLSIEAQLSKDILSPIDIGGINNNNPNFQKKIDLAKFALKRSNIIKLISPDVTNSYSIIRNNNNTNNFNTTISSSNTSTTSKTSNNKFNKKKKNF
jgi:protein unc-79